MHRGFRLIRSQSTVDWGGGNMASAQPSRAGARHALLALTGLALTVALTATVVPPTAARDSPLLNATSGYGSQPGVTVDVDGRTLRVRSLSTGSLPIGDELLSISTQSPESVTVSVTGATLARQREAIQSASSQCQFIGEDPQGADPALECQLSGGFALLDIDLSALTTATATSLWWHSIPLKFQGGSGPDGVQGGTYNDWITGGPGDDQLSGGAGDDVITGGPGTDWLDGEEGKDLLHARDGEADHQVKCSYYGDHADPKVPYDFAEWDEGLDSPELCQELLPTLEPVRNEAPPLRASLEAGQPGGVALSGNYAWIGGLNQQAFRVDVLTGRQEALSLGQGVYFHADAGGLWALKEGRRATDPWTIRELEPATGSVISEGEACRGAWTYLQPSIATNSQLMALACRDGSIRLLDRSTLSLVESIQLRDFADYSHDVMFTEGALWISGMKRENRPNIRLHVAMVDLSTYGVTRVPTSACRKDYGSQRETGVVAFEQERLWCSSGQYVRVTSWPDAVIEREFLPLTEIAASASANGHLFLVGRDGDAWEKGWRFVIFDLEARSLVWKSPIDFNADKLGSPVSIAVQSSDLWVASYDAVSRYSIAGLPGAGAGTPVGRPPGAVRELEVRSLPGQLFVDWEAPTVEGQPNVTHYEYQVQGGPWRRTPLTHALITRGADASRVLIKVRAHSISAFGPEASTSSAPLPARAPGTVATLQGRALKCGARFDWTPPRHWGGATPKHYEYSVTIGQRELPWAKAGLKDPSVEWRDCNLRGKTMEIVVRAVNSAGLKSSRLIWDEVFIPKRPPKPIEEEPELECPLYWYFIDQAITALSNGDVFNYLRYLDLAREARCW